MCCSRSPPLGPSPAHLREAGLLGPGRQGLCKRALGAGRRGRALLQEHGAASGGAEGLQAERRPRRVRVRQRAGAGQEPGVVQAANARGLRACDQEVHGELPHVSHADSWQDQRRPLHQIGGMSIVHRDEPHFGYTSLRANCRVALVYGCGCGREGKAWKAEAGCGGCPALNFFSCFGTWSDLPFLLPRKSCQSRQS